MTEKENTVAGGADDITLVARMVAGDCSALAVAYDRYASMVYSIACRVTRDEALAEEILQDVFFQLWRLAERFDPARGSLPGWLAVTARNRAISRVRSRHGVPVDLDSAIALVSAAVAPERPIQRETLVSELRSRIEALPDSQRDVMELAYFEGMSHGEIAERTGKPLGTVKTLLRSAVHSLRLVLGEPEPGERESEQR